MAYQVYLLLLTVFYSLNQAASEVYYITTNSESAQIDLCTAPCLTLSEFMVSLSHSLSFSNTTLAFLPGTHYLTVNVSVSNLDQFSMTSDHESITAKVVCKNYSHIRFSYSRYISISNLEFIGCGGNQVEHVEEFTVKDAKFEGQNASRVLVIIETAAQVVNSTFRFNRGGKVKQLIGEVFHGGAIIASGSKINISQSRFENNEAQDGGAIYIVHSTIIIDNSSFTNNSADIRGGALISWQSIVTIIASDFDINTATEGGVVFSVVSFITIETSEFYINAAKCGGVLASFRSNIKIKKSKFDFNTVTSRDNKNSGGVIYCYECTITIETSKFVNNTATTNGSRVGGGVLYSDESNVTVKASKFDGNTAITRGHESGGGVMYFRGCTISIETCEFYDNIANGSRAGGGVMCSFYCTISIETSEFDNNTANTYEDNSGSGGVLLIMFSSSTTMKANKFNCNTARYGGVLYCVQSNILIVASRFYNNSATSYGAVLLSIGSIITIEGERIAAVYERSFNPGDGNDVTNNTEGAVAYTKDMNGSLQVVENRARYGVIFFQNSDLYVNYSGSVILSNNVGSLMAINSKIFLIGSIEVRYNSHGLQKSNIFFQGGGALTLLHSTVYIYGSCTLHHNRAEDGAALFLTASILFVYATVTIEHNVATRNGGGIYLSNSLLHCQWNCTFLLNNNYAGEKGGGVHAISSTITVTPLWNASTEPKLHFTKNRAKMGGGLSLESNAKLHIWNYVFYYQYTVAFIGNSADTYGGALYVDDDTNSGSCTSSSKMECIFQVLGVSLYSKLNLTGSIYFSQNHANISGSTLYGGLLDRCALRLSQLAEDIYNYHVSYSDRVAYFKQISYKTIDEEKVFVATNISISSRPVKVCLCIKKEHNCSHQDQTQVKKGEAFNVSLVAVDQTEQPVNATIHASLESAEFEGGLSEGQMTTKIQGECTNLTFNVVSPRNDENLILYALDGPCKDAYLSRRVIKVQFLNCSCPIGFQISGRTDINCSCDCHSKISQHTKHCDGHTGSFIKKSNSRAWISYTNDTNVTGYLLYQNCPFDYCNSLSPPINLNQPNGADAQCAFNRSSLLCGFCYPGLSLSLGSSQCLQCPSHWPTLLAGITLAAILAGIALVALLLVLNMTVAVGSLNGQIFYANIVYANRSILLPFRETSIVTVFISLLNLELGVDTCYFPGMDTYIKTWLQLAFPAFLFYLVILIIAVSSYSIRFSKLIGNKDPVATLASLILLSYAKILQICFESLSVGILKYPDGSSKALWLPDATVSYLQGKHVPLFIAAVLILLIGLIYTAVLFLWQWRFYLPRWKIFTVCLRSQKLQFFIETYHAPFTFKYRYWTGLLLIARAILYLVAAANVSNNPQLALSAIVFTMSFILLLIAFIDIRMYKKMPLNILETFCIINLLIFSIFTWYSLSSANINQKAVSYTSVISALVTLVLIILYHVYTYTSIFSKLRKMDLSRMIKKFRVNPRIRARSHQRPPPDNNIHRFNELLDMIAGPANTNDYNVPLLDRQPVEPTYSVVELPKPQHTDEPVPEEAIIRDVPGPGVTADAV